MINALHLFFHSWGAYIFILPHRNPCANIPLFVFSSHAESYSFHLDCSLGLELAFRYIKHLVFYFCFLNSPPYILTNISYFPQAPWLHTGEGEFLSLRRPSICCAAIILLGESRLPQLAQRCPLTARVTVHPWPGGSFISCRILQGYPYKEHFMPTEWSSEDIISFHFLV